LACRTEGNWSYASGSRFSAAGENSIIESETMH
ncbi:uncharacterized protein METZ01_LOCUS486286, partial [marine metagenome]